MNPLIARFENICHRMHQALERSGRNLLDAKLVAVSKKHEASAVASLAEYWLGKGQAIFGESYVQEALEKIPAVEALLVHKKIIEQGQAGQASPLQANAQAGHLQPEWHFIGGIQSRKAKSLVGQFALIHSVHSLKVAQNLHKAWEDLYAGKAHFLGTQKQSQQKILLQVNIGAEPQKSGVLPDKLEELCNSIQTLQGVEVSGLMCLPPSVEKAEMARPYFAALRELRNTLRENTGLALPHLSMGMSMDFEVALEEGATLIRVGTDIFGARE